MQRMRRLHLAHKFRFELDGAKTLHFAIDVVIAFNQANVFHFGAHLDHRRAAFELEVFDHGHGVAVCQQVADRIFPNFFFCLFFISVLLPLVCALWADEHVTICIGEFRVAFGALWDGHATSPADIELRKPCFINVSKNHSMFSAGGYWGSFGM